MNGSIRIFTLSLIAFCALEFPATCKADFQSAEQAYENGEYKIAIAEFLKLAEQGHIESQHSLAIIYNHNKDHKDYIEAEKWYQLVAENGGIRYQRSLYYFYRSTAKSVPENLEKAKLLLHQLAEQGDVASQKTLAFKYQRGSKLVTQDHKEAIKWFRAAAEQRDVLSQSSLGRYYRTGDGVAQNYKEAMKWYQLAAEQWFATAQRSMGAMYRDGLGVPQNFIKAHMWFNISAANDSMSASRNRDYVADSMTQEDISKAQELASKWIEEYEARQTESEN